MTNSYNFFPMVILCGGKATRLGKLTEALPKSLVPINGVPFIEHQILALKKENFKKIILCLGYLGEQIVDYVISKRRFGMDIQFSFDGLLPLGTAGAIRNAFPLLDDNFFVMYGDSYLEVDFGEVFVKFRASLKSKKRPLALMTIYENKDENHKNNVIFKDNKIINYDKENYTEEMNYIDYGLGVFNKKALSTSFHTFKSFDLSVIYKENLKRNSLLPFVVRNKFYEIGSLSGIKELESKLSLDKSKKLW